MPALASEFQSEERSAIEDVPAATGGAGDASTTSAARVQSGEGWRRWPLDVLITVVALPIAAVVLWRRDVIRPGSLLRAGRRVLPPEPWTLWLAGAVLVFLAAPLGGGVAAAIDKGVFDDAESSARYQAIAAVGSYGAALAASLVLLVVMRRIAGAGVEGAWIGARWRDAWWGLLAIVGALPFVEAVNIGGVMVYRLISHHEPPVLGHSTLDLIVGSPSDPWVWVIGAAAVVGAPIVEEVLYRGMLQTAVLRMTGNAWISIAVTSVIFAASHFGVVEWYGLPALAVLSVAMGMAFERFKSLGVPIVMHMVFNAGNVVLAVWVK